MLPHAISKIISLTCSFSVFQPSGSAHKINHFIIVFDRYDKELIDRALLKSLGNVCRNMNMDDFFEKQPELVEVQQGQRWDSVLRKIAEMKCANAPKFKTELSGGEEKKVKLINVILAIVPRLVHPSMLEGGAS